MRNLLSILLLCLLLASCGEEKTVEGGKTVQERAKAGNAMAQYNLGVMYANADGVPKDKTARAKSGITVNVARTVEVALSSFLLSATTGSNLAGAPLTKFDSSFSASIPTS
jgi:predicted small secreted protein